MFFGPYSYIHSQALSRWADTNAHDLMLTTIVNTSLEFDFSPELKRAFILPLLEKAILDCEILKNFRPVSNLSFLLNLIERIVCV